jgi:hypothetical protein
MQKAKFAVWLEKLRINELIAYESEGKIFGWTAVVRGVG